ncbi:MAG TPA: hypothetical protein VE621_24415 [Bryobacteraceae bacterium]|nr:hypothetical protein [Bryobacteraceae bacterium]
MQRVWSRTPFGVSVCGEEPPAPLLEGDDEAPNRAYIREFTLARVRQYGSNYGFEAAEPFHYIGPAALTVDE